jgi:hypothetical protein
MNTSALTIKNAPRDPNELAKIGRFNLRRIAEELGLFTDEASKARFMAGKNTDMAQALAVHLQQLDQNGGAPVVQPPNLTVVPNTPAPQRQPSNEAAKAEPAPQAQVNGNAGVVEALLKVINAQSKKIDLLTEKVEELVSETNAFGEGLEVVKEVVRGNTRTSVISTALSLSLAEQVLQAPREEILQSAINDQTTVAALVAALDQEDEEEGKE